MSGSARGVDDNAHVDVVVVGGGPAGCSAGVFTARYGLETAIFDRGNAALRRSAYIANYLGFPAGIDIDTFYALIHDHVEEAGCRLVEEMVVSIDHAVDASAANASETRPRFTVESQDGRTLTAERVIASAWYDGEYLRPLVGEEAFEVHEHHGDEHERFDPGYPGEDGRTPIQGLYVAAPNGGRNAQAIVSAGHGAHVARSLIEDHRLARGYPDGVLAAHYDWLRPESEFTGGWADRDRWREFFETELPENHDRDETELDELRERYIDRAFRTRLTPAEIERRTGRGHRRLLEHLDDQLVLERARQIREEADAESARQRQCD